MIAKTIANDFYEIGYDTSANRMYLRIKGFWKSPEEVPNFVHDIDTISNKLTNGFTLVADLRQMKTPPIEINEIHHQSQQTVTRNGLSHTAEILPEKDIILSNVVKTIANKSGMQKREFSNMREAEAWLDSLVN